MCQIPVLLSNHMMVTIIYSDDGHGSAPYNIITHLIWKHLEDGWVNGTAGTPPRVLTLCKSYVPSDRTEPVLSCSSGCKCRECFMKQRVISKVEIEAYGLVISLLLRSNLVAELGLQIELTKRTKVARDHSAPENKTGRRFCLPVRKIRTFGSIRRASSVPCQSRESKTCARPPVRSSSVFPSPALPLRFVH